MNPKSQGQNFFSPYSHYHGLFAPGNLTSNTNLQEFANRVGIVCALEKGGKISAEEAYQRILELWKSLSDSKNNPIDHQFPDQWFKA